MYKIIMDGVYIYHPWSRERCITEGALTQEKSKNGSCEFSIPITHPLAAQIKPRKSIVEVRFFQKRKADTTVYRGVVMTSVESGNLEITVSTEGDLVFLHDSVLRPFTLTEGPGKATPDEYFRWLLEQHNSQVDDFKKFTIGEVTVQGDVKSYTQDDYQTIWEALEALVLEYGGYVRSRTVDGIHYIDYLAEEETDDSQPIWQGSNVIDITKSVKTDEMATRIIPLGAPTNNGRPLTIASVNDGLDYLQDDDALQEFGVITKTVEFSEIQSPAELLKAGLEELQRQKGATVVTELSAVDLAEAGYDVNLLRVGAQVPCVAPAYGVNQMLPIEKKVTNLLNPAKTRVVLGGTILTYTQAQLKKVFEKNKVTIDRISDQQINEICV